MRLEFPDEESAAQALRDAYDLDGGDEYAAIAKAVNGHEVDVRQSPNIDPRYLYFKNGLYVITDKRDKVNEFFSQHEQVTDKLVNLYKYPPSDALAKRALADKGKVVAIIHPDGSERYLYYDLPRDAYVITDIKPPIEYDFKPPLEPDPNDPNTYRRAADKFLSDCGLPPVPDAIDQLTDAFLPCLRIICERGYHPEGNTWRAGGWRGILTDIKKKSNRLWYRSWIKGGFDDDSARDLMNFAGFYYRLGNQGKEWGDWGQPGSAGPAPKKYPVVFKYQESPPETLLLGHNTSSESTQWLSPEEWNARNRDLDVEPPEIVVRGKAEFPIPSKETIRNAYRKIKDNPQA